MKKSIFVLVGLILGCGFLPAFSRFNRKKDCSSNRVYNLPENLQELPDLKLFGSNQITEQNLTDILCSYNIDPDQLVIVCLRGEPHLFLNGQPTYLHGTGNNCNLIQSCEDQLAKAINAGRTTQVNVRKKSFKVNGEKIVDSVPKDIEKNTQAKTESEIVADVDIHIDYFRICNADLLAPTIHAVSEFIEHMRPYVGKKYILLHCHKGKGRTTFFAIIVDMMLNSQNSTYTEILERTAHRLTPSVLKDQPKSIEKKKVLQFVYDYLRSPSYSRHGKSHSTFEEYMRKHHSHYLAFDTKHRYERPDVKPLDCEQIWL